MMMASTSRHTQRIGQRVFYFNPEAQIGSGVGPDAHSAPPPELDRATTPESTTGTHTPSDSNVKSSTTVN